MMSTKVKGTLLLLAMGMAAFFYACSKYKDPPPGVPNDELKKRHYCNDPLAVNYNWGFPGTPDSTICTYPVDSFLGAWVLTDTAFFPDGTVQGSQTRNLVFTSTEDTVKRHLSVSGWCGNTMPFLVTADKYKKAVVDTLLVGSPGQYICNNTDTLSGGLRQGNDTLLIDFTITNAGSTLYHKGVAVRP
ncbi:hypothetical protein [Taibaiella koreensis]|uniref:hypothetical protein n=1 Tax=Taibaiella koreensis TaxID=1268548 RepID=UPI0013C2FFDA|nr:hypothetical protein [Taibaiella koreensis]